MSPPDPQQRTALAGGTAPLAVLRRAFDRAATAPRVGEEIRHLQIAGQPATLSSAEGPLLAAFARPFRHLIAPQAVDPAAADPAAIDSAGPARPLSIRLLRREPGGEPPLPEGGGSCFAPGQMAQARIEHAEGGRFVGYQRGETVAALDRSAGELVVWCGPGFPASDRGQPLFALFAVWLHDLDLQLVHAGLVARGDRGALLGGAGGSGKSTTALACMRSGLAYLGDDLIALSLPEGTERGGREARGYSLYNSARLEPANLERFPELQGTVEPLDPREPDKLVLYPLEGELAGASGGSARIRAVLLPRVTGGAPRALPLSPAKALLGLAPSSIRSMAPQPMAAGLARLARLVEAVPCHQLEVSEDLAAVAHEVERVLADDDSAERGRESE